MRIGAGETAEVRAFATADAGDKERHRGLLRPRRSGQAEAGKSDDGQDGKSDC
jgi:hypothetical protein